MKTISVIFVTILLVFISGNNQGVLAQDPAPDQTIEAQIKVLGLCGMCKERIERAALSVRGVRSASWDQKKNLLTVSYRSSRASQEEIERAIAKAGHDTQNFITDEHTYKNLHHCCKYPRDPEMLKNNKLFNQD